jgi:hypothetical protein
MSVKYCPGSYTQQCPTPDHCEDHCHFNTADVETRRVKPYPATPVDQYAADDIEYNITRSCIALAASAFLFVVFTTLIMSAVIVLGSLM